MLTKESNGANLDLQDEDGQSALMHACAQNRLEAAKLLIEKGANLDLQDEDGRSALINACYKNQPELVKLLLAKGANPDLQNWAGWTALMQACDNNQPELVKLLVAKGANLDLQAKDGSTALTFACDEKQREVAKLLIENGANLDLSSSFVGLTVRDRLARTFEDIKDLLGERQFGRERSDSTTCTICLHGEQALALKLCVTCSSYICSDCVCQLLKPRQGLTRTRSISCPTCRSTIDRETAALSALTLCPDKYRDLPEDLRQSERLFCHSQQHPNLSETRGPLLKFAGTNVQDNRHLVLMAMRHTTGDVLQFASSALQDDEEVVRKAVDKNAASIEYASERNKQKYACLTGRCNGC